MDPNPYASPESVPDASADFYQTDSTRLTVGEYRQIAKNPIEFLLGVICKLCGIRLGESSGFARNSQSLWFDPSDLPAHVIAKIEPAVGRAKSLGFANGSAYSLLTIGRSEGYCRALIGDDRSTIMLAIYVRTQEPGAVDEKSTFALVSRISENNWLITSGGKRDLNPPPGFEVEHMSGKPFEDVLQRHRQRLLETATSPALIHDNESLVKMISDYEKQAFEHYVARGVYVPLSPSEIERLSNQPPVDPAVAPTKYATLDLISWILIGVGIFSLFRGEGNQAQTIFRIATLSVGGAGVVLVWILRFLNSRSAKAKQREADS